MNQELEEQIAKILTAHRRTMSDHEWLLYYEQIGFPPNINSLRTKEEKIKAAVQFNAAESGILPDAWYEAE